MVADYVIAAIKGKGEPNFADCTAFFGAGSRVCDIYRPATPAGASGGNSTCARPQVSPAPAPWRCC